MSSNRGRTSKALNTPEYLELRGNGADKSLINMQLQCNEIDGVRTIHAEVHSEFPFGHISENGAKSLRAWLDVAIPWLKEKPTKGAGGAE